MKTKHTPGEWKVGKKSTSRNKEYIPIGTAGYFKTIAQTTPLNDLATEEDWANAQLMASAPVLLDACLEMMNYFEVNNKTESVIYKMLSLATKQAIYKPL